MFISEEEKKLKTTNGELVISRLKPFCLLSSLHALRAGLCDDVERYCSDTMLLMSSDN